MVLVDGAHALGQVELNLNELNADFYVANCHKWFCNTRGSAILHVRRDRQHLISPLTVSWGEGFAASFMWPGERLRMTLTFTKTQRSSPRLSSQKISCRLNFFKLIHLSV